MKYFIILLSIGFLSTNIYGQCAPDQASVWENTWQSCQESTNPNTSRGESHWIRYDLGDTTRLANVQVWNTNEAGKTDQGFRNVIVDYSIDGVNWSQLGIYEWIQAPGTPKYSGFEGCHFNGALARYVLITAVSNWGGNCYGLAEIRFNMVPSCPQCEELDCEEDDDDPECLAVEEVELIEIGSTEAFILWETSDGAIEYLVSYRNTEDTEWIEIIVDEPEIFLEDLEPSVDYELFVIVICEDEETEGSEPLIFSTEESEEDETCRVPDELYIELIDDDVLLVEWEEVPDAINYRLRYRINEPGEPWNRSTDPEPFRELEDIETDVEYVFELRVRCDDGWTPWGEPHYFLLEEGSIVSLQEDPRQEVNNLNVFPNPAYDRVQVDFQSLHRGQGQLLITNTTGARVITEDINLNTGENNFIVKLGQLPSGVYYMTIAPHGRKAAHEKIMIIGR